MSRLAKTLKAATLRTAQVAGVNASLRTFGARGLLVACYHSVIPDSVSSVGCRTRVSVSETQFEQQLRYIKRNFQPISLTQLTEHINHGAPLPPRSALITFDDGFANNLHVASPVLLSHAIPAAFFLTTNYISTDRILWPNEIDEFVLQWPKPTIPLPSGSCSAHIIDEFDARTQLADRIREQCKRLTNQARLLYMEELRSQFAPQTDSELRLLYEFLTWDEVRELARLGFEIGSHTLEHPILSQLPDGELFKELFESKQTIEKELATPCNAIAYPNGGSDDFNDHVIATAQAIGYRVGFKLEGGLCHRPQNNPLEIDRVSVVRELTPDAFAARVSGFTPLLQRTGKLVSKWQA